MNGVCWLDAWRYKLIKDDATLTRKSSDLAQSVWTDLNKLWRRFLARKLGPVGLLPTWMNAAHGIEIWRQNWLIVLLCVFWLTKKERRRYFILSCKQEKRQQLMLAETDTTQQQKVKSQWKQTVINVSDIRIEIRDRIEMARNQHWHEPHTIILNKT